MFMSLIFLGVVVVCCCCCFFLFVCFSYSSSTTEITSSYYIFNDICNTNVMNIINCDEKKNYIMW